jgi:hypothetical protein
MYAWYVQSTYLYVLRAMYVLVAVPAAGDGGVSILSPPSH